MRCCWLFVVWSAATFAFADVVTLENPHCKLVVSDDARAITALAGANGPQDLIDAAGASPIYSILLVDQKAPITAKDAAHFSVKRNGDTIVIEGEHEKPLPLHVSCRLVLASGTSMVSGRITVSSQHSFKLASVQFPTVSFKLPIGSTSDDDAILLPNCDGCLIQDPLKNGRDVHLPYPGSASIQCLAAFDPSGGVYMASLDSQCFTKTLGTQKRGKTLDLCMRSLPPQSEVTCWSLPYDIILAPMREQGDKPITWETAAELYRAWAVQQPWCGKSLQVRVKSGDVPQWLTEPSLFYTYSLRGTLNDKTFGNRLSQVQDQAGRWKQALGHPTTFMLMSWEKRDSWFTPDYFPPFGGQEAFTQLTRALHDSGHHTLVFLSGLKWTLHKSRAHPSGEKIELDDQAEFDRSGRPHAISDASGHATIFGQPDRDVGQHAMICPGTQLGREMLVRVTRNCQELGIDCVQADQIVGGGTPPCFHPAHQHAPGGGNWAARALYDTFDQIRREGKARSRDFAFSIEEPAEFFIPVLDTYHARDYAQGRWPRSGPGVVGVPLFTHVYHDFLHGYGGDSAFVSDKRADLALYHQAMNLVCGKAAGVAVWTRAYDPMTTDALQQRMLKSHLDLWSGAGRDFLVYGRRLPSPVLETPARKHNLTEKGAKSPRVVELPIVLHARWQAPDGRKATVLASTSAEPITFKLDGKPMTLDPAEVKLIAD